MSGLGHDTLKTDQKEAETVFERKGRWKKGDDKDETARSTKKATAPVTDPSAAETKKMETS